MTSFEKFFTELKETLENRDLYDIWPSFSPKYDENEYLWSKLGNLGEVLILHCGSCDGPMDPRHSICSNCIEKREYIANRDYRNSKKPTKEWNTVLLCRVYSEEAKRGKRVLGASYVAKRK
ncbi:MAG: hypothetical protein ACFFBS_06335 [Promethearchaeota archaeon]